MDVTAWMSVVFILLGDGTLMLTVHPLSHDAVQGN